MVNFPGRDRRRRVLKDEVLTASASHSPSPYSDNVESDAPRYSEAAGVEHHPQITDFVPRRYRTIATIILAGACLTATLSACEYFLLQSLEMRSLPNAAALGVSGAGGLAAWVSAIVLLTASVTSAIIHSIRRHRIDDYRGRYRVWRAATLACLTMSALSVTGLHHFIATGMTHLVGWSALRDGAIWWLLLPGLPMGWIGLRALFDTRGCRFATSLLATAVVSYSIAATIFLGAAPIANARQQTIAVGASILMGHWLLLAGVIAYARYVILDAQGLIPVRKRSVVNRNADLEPSMEELEKLTCPTSTTKANAKSLAMTSTSSLASQPARPAADDRRWVDGSRPERRRYHEDDDDEESTGGERKLSKADRKRLRRLKSDGRAA